MIVLCLPHCNRSVSAIQMEFLFSLAYVFAAVIFESGALRPTCLSPAWVSTKNQPRSSCTRIYEEFTHHYHRGLHSEGTFRTSLWKSVCRSEIAIRSSLKQYQQIFLCSKRYQGLNSIFQIRLDARNSWRVFRDFNGTSILLCRLLLSGNKNMRL